MGECQFFNFLSLFEMEVALIEFLDKSLLSFGSDMPIWSEPFGDSHLMIATHSDTIYVKENPI